VSALGGLVRVQRRQRGGGWRAGDSNAFVTTHFGAAAAVLGLVAGGVDPAAANRRCWEAFRARWPGLVGITPAAGFVTPMAALVIGFVAGSGLLPRGNRAEEAARL
jgi:ammonia channel protein AmtB